MKLKELTEGRGGVFLQMILIFIMAGAFAQTARDMGAVDATVGAALRLVPSSLLYVGLFLTTCFISMSLGTSVGTIVALTPIASEMALQNGIGVPFMVGIVVGGAFFGDNLSFISDTTIAATQGVGCRMSDKFKANIKIVAPAVVIVSIIYLLRGNSLAPFEAQNEYELLKILPYILVIVLALTGIKVWVILLAGICSVAVIGFSSGSFADWAAWAHSAWNGVLGMKELIIITVAIGIVIAIITRLGILDKLMKLMTAHISSKRGAEASIASLVFATDLCTANNTTAIIGVSGIAREIAIRYDIEPKRAASLLDTFSCLAQSIIPYGAQLLMAGSLAGISPVSVMPYLYYPMIMGVFAVISILHSK